MGYEVFRTKYEVYYSIHKRHPDTLMISKVCGDGNHFDV